ncbi:MAG: PQQ-like beta-propeller repeat protein [Bacteroidales bacterium]|jgi:hypothetical protein|nr:PQQ-like beta-propeller repeat protein [Bacteroidales bacterium]
MKNKPLFLFTLCALMLFSATAFGQKKGLKIVSEPIILGKNSLDGSDIVGVEYRFPDRIENYFVDTTTKLLTVQIRGFNFFSGLKKKGNILQYDLINKKILWSKAIDYDVHELLKFDSLLILNEYNDGYGLDAHTGETLWTVKNYIYFANPKYNVGVAYEYLSAGEGYYTNNLFGVDLLKSKILWKRNINRGLGWNDYFYLNDSTLMVVASGLHTINIKTGKGWDYHAITGLIIKPDNSAIAGAVIGGIIGGIIGGLISGMYVIPIIYTPLQTGDDIIRDIASNALIDNNFIYFAFKDTIVKLKKESGEVVWKNSFMKDLTSNSLLFMDDTMVYMVNKGFAVKMERPVMFGETFIAAFDKQTGEQKYLSLLNNECGSIYDYKLIDNELYLLFQNGIRKYSIETGTKIAENLISRMTFGALTNFVGNDIFIENKNGYFLNINQFDLGDIHAQTSLNDIYFFDNPLNTTYSIGDRKIWKFYFEYKDYKLIAQHQKTLIIDNDGKKIAEVAFSSNAFIIDNILYEKRDKSVVAIDLQSILY